jgi:FkbM family methyltransferase
VSKQMNDKFIKLVKRCLRAFWYRMRPIVRMQTVFSDWESIKNRKRLHKTQTFIANDHLTPLRVRILDGNCVYCRPGTTDIKVFDESFFQEFHVPPKGLGRIDTILDLGSNIGLTMAHYASVFPNTKILGIELDYDNVVVCRKNIGPYSDRCRVIWGAAWTENGEVTYGGTAAWSYRVGTAEKPKGRVRAFTVSSLIDLLGVSWVDFVKMDVEGAEENLLANAEPWIGRVRCLKVEVHPPYTVEACLGDLRKLGLECRRDWRHIAWVVARNVTAESAAMSPTKNGRGGDAQEFVPFRA